MDESERSATKKGGEILKIIYQNEESNLNVTCVFGGTLVGVLGLVMNARLSFGPSYRVDEKGEKGEGFFPMEGGRDRLPRKETRMALQRN